MKHEGRSDLRVAAVLRRELSEIATRTKNQTVETGERDAGGKPIVKSVERPLSEDERWAAIAGDPALREAFQAAFELPTPLTKLPKDERVEVLRTAAKAAFGDDGATRFAEPGAIDAVAVGHAGLQDFLGRP